MDPKSVRLLRLYGWAALALFFLFAFFPTSTMSGMAEPYKEALSASLTIGVGLLLLAEIVPLVESFKAGGFEIKLARGVSSEFAEIQKRLTNLEWVAEREGRTLAELRLRPAKPPPALKKPQRRPDDPWKGRFGEAAVHPPYALSADFTRVGSKFVQVELKVTGPEDIENLECVEFYLHDTFKPNDVVPSVYRAGEAKLSLLVYGGFTVGVWIPCSDIELELDLTELPNAPDIIRHR